MCVRYIQCCTVLHVVFGAFQSLCGDCNTETQMSRRHRCVSAPSLIYLSAHNSLAFCVHLHLVSTLRISCSPPCTTAWGRSCLTCCLGAGDQNKHVCSPTSFCCPPPNVTDTGGRDPKVNETRLGPVCVLGSKRSHLLYHIVLLLTPLLADSA